MRFEISFLGLVFSLLPAAALAQDWPQVFFGERDYPAWFQFVAAPRGSFLGVDVCEIDHDRTRSLNLKEERGVEITRVQEDSPASKAGLSAGDVVLDFNGQRVEGTEQFMRLVRETPPGREVKLLVSRAGAQRTIVATVGSRPAPLVAGIPREGWSLELSPDLPRTLGVMRPGYLGLEAESLSSQLAAYFGVKDGVLVRSVQAGSAAERAGIRAGDVITRIDGEAVQSAGEITRAVRNARSKRSFPVTVVREKREMTVNVTLEEPGGGKAGLPPRVRTVAAGSYRL